MLFLKGDLLYSFVVQVCLFHLAIMQKGWVGWLKEGKAYLSDVEAEELDRRFGSYSASELIDAASFLIEALRKMETIRLIWTLRLAVSEYRIKSWRMPLLYFCALRGLFCDDEL